MMMQAGHRRPLFVLYGASMVEYAFRPEGWGAALTNMYSRQADVLLRGYKGWNTRRALEALETIFPKNSPIPPSLVVIFFGTNDAAFPLPSGRGQYVPILEYKDNLRHICSYMMGLSDTTRVILIAPPPIFEEARRTVARVRFGEKAAEYLDRTNERTRAYAEACISVAQEMGAGVVNLWSAIQKKSNWQTECLSDGMHLSAEGGKILLEELLTVIKSENWVPSLIAEHMRSDFTEPSPYDMIHPYLEAAQSCNETALL
ncbi:hypothetical protein O6H91_04G064400 [Diphasiastrum complanatum]|uniref:Uncharacterized protein n=1 Tax=Diphasiastrum complanatum TaxID=34168 RepID=A0ACC2DXF5_DIPCM|nr:hypothetical protein O6H91_04G064400 [Diphasiastrum complanatum]